MQSHALPETYARRPPLFDGLAITWFDEKTSLLHYLYHYEHGKRLTIEPRAPTPGGLFETMRANRQPIVLGTAAVQRLDGERQDALRIGVLHGELPDARAAQALEEPARRNLRALGLVIVPVLACAARGRVRRHPAPRCRWRPPRSSRPRLLHRFLGSSQSGRDLAVVALRHAHHFRGVLLLFLQPPDLEREQRVLRHLEALLLVADTKNTYLVSGNGDVIEPDDDIVAIGCDMARQCHLDTCPTGIATQREES